MKTRDKILGVIGGLGPLATAYLIELIVKFSDVKVDQKHLSSLVYNATFIPDRTKYIIDKTQDNPLPDMIKVGQCLVSQGVDYLAIPCITAHYFYDELQNNIDVPIINVIDETICYLKEFKVKSVGLMASDGTIESKIFQKKLEDNNIKCFIPKNSYQNILMELIYNNVKANSPIRINGFYEVENHLRESGAEVIILGCTELSLIKRDYKLKGNILDVLEVLATKAILMGGIPVKKNSENLIVN